MRILGSILTVQVQTASLKVGEQPEVYYDPTPVQEVKKLLLTSGGVLGITSTGEYILDIHHRDHPASRNDSGKNDISFGFSSHYREMRQRFGEHLQDGCAGENILIETEDTIRLADLGLRIGIQSQSTGQLVYLTEIIVATPCVEFSHFAAREEQPLSGQKLKETLQFLHHGRRGFYASFPEAQHEGIIQPGDMVLVIDQTDI